MGFCNCSMFCYALLCVHSSFAIISMGKRELVALLCLVSWWLVLPHDATGLSAVCDCGIPDHTHLLFFDNLNVIHILVNVGTNLRRWACACVYLTREVDSFL